MTQRSKRYIEQRTYKMIKYARIEKYFTPPHLDQNHRPSPSSMFLLNRQLEVVEILYLSQSKIFFIFSLTKLNFNQPLPTGDFNNLIKRQESKKIIKKSNYESYVY